MESILIQTNAKINLDFKILAKRPDGYHQIETVVQSIDLADFLLFKKTGKDYFSGALICPTPENIILKAKKVLEKSLNKKLPCQIHLQKVIPIAAGLGGGSADAAATLVALNKMYNLKLSPQKLAEIGAKVGADLPFFFYGGTCKIEGMGEKVALVKKKLSKFFLLFRPHQRIETKEMYKLYDKTGKDFLALAREICPEIKGLEKYLAKFKLKAKLSGSGPTIFSGVSSYHLAKKIAEGYYPGFNGDIFICRPQKEAIKIL